MDASLVLVPAFSRCLSPIASLFCLKPPRLLLVKCFLIAEHLQRPVCLSLPFLTLFSLCCVLIDEILEMLWGTLCVCTHPCVLNICACVCCICGRLIVIPRVQNPSGRMSTHCISVDLTALVSKHIWSGVCAASQTCQRVSLPAAQSVLHDDSATGVEKPIGEWD